MSTPRISAGIRAHGASGEYGERPVNAAHRAKALAQTQYGKVGHMDIELSCTERGTGEPLLLLHGNGESREYFSAQLEYFSGMYRTIAIDTRGHGATPRGRAPFTLEQFAQDLRGFMDARRIDSAHLLGFSDGGNIALLFSLRWPERVHSLVLNGANLYPLGMKPGVWLSVELGYLWAGALARLSTRMAGRAELLRLMARQPHIAPAQLGGLDVPTLVIAGTRDMIRDSHTRLICASLPDAELAILPGDHFIAAHAPDVFNARVAQFLSAHSRSAANPNPSAT